MLLNIAAIHSFSLLYGILLCEYSVMCSLILLLRLLWAILLWVLGITLPRTSSSRTLMPVFVQGMPHEWN